MKIYLSGPMTGIKDYNYPAFELAAQRLRKAGYDIVSPREITPETHLAREIYMRHDLIAVCQCDAIALLDGWEKSDGCKHEIIVGKACGLKFYKYNDGVLNDIDIDNAGKKFDTGKLEWDHMRWGELGQIMEILQFGANKYGWDNFEKVDNAESRYKSALLRHVIAYVNGEENDQESGKHHLAHAGCNVLFLLHFTNNRRKKCNQLISR